MASGSDESENEEDEEAVLSDDDGSFASVDDLDGMFLLLWVLNLY